MSCEASLLHRGSLVTVGPEQFSSAEITSLSRRGLGTGRVPADGGQVLRLGILWRSSSAHRSGREMTWAAGIGAIDSKLVRAPTLAR
jgi:hypothetical protein